MSQHTALPSCGRVGGPGCGVPGARYGLFWEKELWQQVDSGTGAGAGGRDAYPAVSSCRLSERRQGLSSTDQGFGVGAGRSRARLLGLSLQAWQVLGIQRQGGPEARWGRGGRLVISRGTGCTSQASVSGGRRRGTPWVGQWQNLSQEGQRRGGGVGGGARQAR